MKYLLIILFVVGCSEIPKFPVPDPKPPYGRPDMKTEYTGMNDYKIITYTYNCLGGKYVLIDYIRPNLCAEWRSEYYVSGGICK
jgi:hypothetical protein